MTRKTTWLGRVISLGLVSLFGFTALIPQPTFAAGDASKRQKQKNDWRNLASAGAAVAGYGLLKGNKAATVLGTAGAAYSANRYEQERKHQDAAKRSRERYHHTRNYIQNGRKYYHYHGHLYYMDLATGKRHRAD